MTNTMEQERAADAWRRCEGCNREYMILAKGVPALIMNSGLMQTMAFLQDKGKNGERDGDNAHGKLAKQLREWLATHFEHVISSSSYPEFMNALMQASPRDFQEITAEAMAWLRWVRQIAPTRLEGRD